MRPTTRRLQAGAAGAAVACMFALAVPTAASASTWEVEGSAVTTAVGGMNVVGFDEAVANANGYEIITDESGNQTSVPVSDAAKALDAARVDPAILAAKSLGLADDSVARAPEYDEAVGDCGISYIGAEKGPSDFVTYETGYVVDNAVAAYTWNVTARGFISGESDNYSGGPSGPEFVAEGGLTAIGPGNAFVPGVSPAAQATLVDGRICYSGGSSVGFP